MNKTLGLILVGIFMYSCNTAEKNPKVEESVYEPVTLTLVEANRLSKLPLHCMQVQYPNKPGLTLTDSTYLQTPQALHPAFYGCYDWHSSVHGHWSLVRLLKEFPDLEDEELVKAKLLENLSEENLKIETAYFEKPGNTSFERTYGWAWLLKLAEELHTWDDPLARTLEANLNPLTEVMIKGYMDFLPKLNYPVRVGEHPNTAFGLTFAYDFAIATNHQALKALIEQRARDFYLKDKGCPITWEPGGTDFLSPCLEEADIMRRILPQEEFKSWLHGFMPELENPEYHLAPGVVSDRTDGKLVHLDGVNFSRAWCLYGIAKALPEYSHLKEVAKTHIAYSLPSIVDDNYEGTHWLGTFAIYALQNAH